MSEKRFIYWHTETQDGKTRASIHLLVGYNQGTITDFQEMAAKLRETFPEAKDGEIQCGTVIISHAYKGFSIITWDHYIPKGTYPKEWHQTKFGRIDYCW
jgi:hypothetical protein